MLISYLSKLLYPTHSQTFIQGASPVVAFQAHEHGGDRRTDHLQPRR
jgi:hypothetical protein